MLRVEQSGVGVWVELLWRRVGEALCRRTAPGGDCPEQSGVGVWVELLWRRVGEAPCRRTAPGGTEIVQPADIAPQAHDLVI